MDQRNATNPLDATTYTARGSLAMSLLARLTKRWWIKEARNDAEKIISKLLDEGSIDDNQYDIILEAFGLISPRYRRELSKTIAKMAAAMLDETIYTKSRELK